MRPGGNRGWLLRLVIAFGFAQGAVSMARPAVSYRALALGADERAVGVIAGVYALLTVALLTAMIMEWLPIPVLFLLGAAIALTVNFPHMPDQKARLGAHAENVLNVSGMVFAAAVFTGVLQGTGMVDHMAEWLVDNIPAGMGPHMAFVTGVLSIPLTYFMSNDGFYFGILPVLAEAGQAHGVSSLEIARASLIGQPLHMSSPLVPAVYVLVGMAKVEFGDHTRFVVKWAAVTSAVVLGAGILFGAM